MKQSKQEILERVLAKLDVNQANVIREYIKKSEEAYKIKAIEKTMYNDGMATGYVTCLKHLGVISLHDARELYSAICMA